MFASLNNSPLLPPSIFFQALCRPRGSMRKCLGPVAPRESPLWVVKRVIWQHRAQVECRVLTVVTICQVRLRKKIFHLPLTGVYSTCSNQNSSVKYLQQQQQQQCLAVLKSILNPYDQLEQHGQSTHVWLGNAAPPGMKCTTHPHVSLGFTRHATTAVSLINALEPTFM